MTHHSPRRRLIFFASLAVVLAACGGSNQGTPEATYLAAIDALQSADSDGFCELAVNDDGTPFTDTDIDQCKGFAAMYIGAIASNDEYQGEWAVSGAQIDGDTATIDDEAVTIDGQPITDSNSAPVELVKVDGKWYIQDLG